MTGSEPFGSPAQPAIGALLAPPGPAQSGLLVHFTGRPSGTGPGGSVPDHIVRMSPAERLRSILHEGRIRGHLPYGMSREPVVAFSEANRDHLAWLIQTRGFPAWGLIFDKRDIFNLGGGPVWYARPDQYADLYGTAAATWAVRYDANPSARSEWTHEQEWRLPTAELLIPHSATPFLLVDDAEWAPAWPVPVLTGNRIAPDGTAVHDPAYGVEDEVVVENLLPPPDRWPPLARVQLDRESGRFIHIEANGG